MDPSNLDVVIDKLVASTRTDAVRTFQDALQVAQRQISKSAHMTSFSRMTILRHLFNIEQRSVARYSQVLQAIEATALIDATRATQTIIGCVKAIKQRWGESFYWDLAARGFHLESTAGKTY